MTNGSDRSTDDARSAADFALARLDELIGELGRAEHRHGAPPAGPHAPTASPVGSPVPANGPASPRIRVPAPTNGAPAADVSARSLEQRRADAEAAVRQELARRQRDIERRRRAFDPDRRARRRSRAAARALRALLQHSLGAEPRPADEINVVIRNLLGLRPLLISVLGEEVRLEAEAARAEAERRARAAVAGLHALFTWAVDAAPPPPAMRATGSLHALFLHALDAAPVPRSEPALDVSVEIDLAVPAGAGTSAPPPVEAAVDTLPALFAFAVQARSSRPRRVWLRWGLAGALTAAVTAAALFAVGVLPPERDDPGGDEAAVRSFTVRSGDPAESVVGQAVRRRIAVHEEPGGAVVRTLEHPISTGAPLVFLVTDDSSSSEWVEVMLPVPPSGSRGWIRRDDLSLGTTDFRIVVRLGDHQLEVWDGDEQVMAADVAVGSEDAPSPGARFYITELLQPPDPDTVYGTYAFGLSGSTNTLEKFVAGEGVVAIHGVGDPAGLGGDVSQGFIGMANADIERLVGALPLGTPVEIAD